MPPVQEGGEEMISLIETLVKTVCRRRRNDHPRCSKRCVDAELWPPLDPARSTRWRWVPVSRSRPTRIRLSARTCPGSVDACEAACLADASMRGRPGRIFWDRPAAPSSGPEYRIRELARNNCGANYTDMARRSARRRGMWEDEESTGGNTWNPQVEGERCAEPTGPLRTIHELLTERLGYVP